MLNRVVDNFIARVAAVLLYIYYIYMYIYILYIYICRYIYILREGGNFETFLKENYAVALESCCLFTKKCN